MQWRGFAASLRDGRFPLFGVVFGARSGPLGTAPDCGAPASPKRWGAAAPRPCDGHRILDLRRDRAHLTSAVCTLRYPPGDLVVVSGLPGSGKSTLIRRAVVPRDAAGAVHRIDSQDARDRQELWLPNWLPYVAYRPVVRVAHYTGLFRALRTGRSMVVHDCGALAWVRRWLARSARRQGRGMHLVLLDVAPETAREGQRMRGRSVSGYAFARHCRAWRRLFGAVEAATSGRSNCRPPRAVLPRECVSIVILDRATARQIHSIRFGAPD